MPEDLTQDNSQQGNLENQEGQQDPNVSVEQQVDWEQDTNPYRKRYQDSQSQITPLVKTLQQFADYDHSTKTWKPKTAPIQQQNNQNPDDEWEQYDPKFRNALNKFVAKQVSDGISKFQQESSFASEYNSKVTSTRAKTVEEFGGEFDFAKNGKFNVESPLYKLANQLLVEKYAEMNPDGTLHRYTLPEAEYLATVEAYAMLKRQEKQGQVQGKEKFNAIQGKGSKASGVKGNLTREEYLKLSPEQQDAFDMVQQGVV